MALDKSKLNDLKLDRSEEGKSSSKSLLWFIALLILLGAGGWGARWWKQNQATTVSVVNVRRVVTGENATVLNATGYVIARRLSTISSKVMGKIIEVSVEEGMNVRTGQVLARLDGSNIDANLKLAEAQLRVSRSALDETNVRIKEAGLVLNRVVKLVQEEIGTQSDLEKATATADAYKAQLTRQIEEISVAEKQIELWKQEVEDRVIRAPFDGVVISKNAQVGEMISPSSAGGFTRTGICTIVDMSSLEIEVDVNEAYINRVQADMPVEAKLDAYPDWKIPCKVIAIIPTADRNKATVKVRIGFNELDKRLLPDMGVKVAFQSVPSDATPTVQYVIPVDAVKEQGGRSVVFVMKGDSVERQAVTLGDERDGDVTVLAGLSASDRVVSPIPDELKTGMNVKANE